MTIFSGNTRFQTAIFLHQSFKHSSFIYQILVISELDDFQLQALPLPENFLILTLHCANFCLFAIITELYY